MERLAPRFSFDSNNAANSTAHGVLRWSVTVSLAPMLLSDFNRALASLLCYPGKNCGGVLALRFIIMELARGPGQLRPPRCYASAYQTRNVISDAVSATSQFPEKEYISHLSCSLSSESANGHGVNGAPGQQHFTTYAGSNGHGNTSLCPSWR